MKELPGKFAAPLIGDTLAFLRDPVELLADRRRDLGPVFRISVLGDTIACFVGPDAFKLFLDDRYFTRASASPPHVQEIMDKDAVPFLEGDRFKVRKEQLMQSFSPAALDAYMPIIERVMRRYLARWEKQASLLWVPELTSMCMTIASALFLGGDPDVDDPSLERGFQSAFAGFLTVPLNLPFTTFGKALKARDEMRARIQQAIALHKSSARDDAMARLLKATSKDGVQMSEAEVAIEIFHFFGAYVPVIGGIAFLMALVGQHSDVKEKLRAEVNALAASGPVTNAMTKALPYLDRVCRESRRARPILPITFFANVKADCEFEGIRIPAGIKAIGAIGGTLHDDNTFPEPMKFDPERWTNASEKQHHAWVPHGGGAHLTAHRCAGEALADLMLKAFAVLVLREYDWSLPAQDFAPAKGNLFALPVGNLDVRFRRS